MKKVGIITLLGYRNYGNRLQNYAVQEVLQKFGFEGDTILYSIYEGTKKEVVIRRIRSIIRKPLSFCLKRLSETLQKESKRIRMRFYVSPKEIKQIAFNKRIQQLNIEREKRFNKFVDENINETLSGITTKSIPADLSERYEYFVIGSDQVWNPSYLSRSPFDFLSFACLKKRVAYAASFGVSKIPNEHIKKYKLGLQQMNYISVREQEGAALIKDLIGREVPVLVDPTMMLDSTEWRKIAIQDASRPNKPYILTYFLWGKDIKVKDGIEQLAKENDFIIIDLNEINDEERYVIGPSEFIDFIDHAELIVTDSFHGTVFSILFQKPFLVCNHVGKSQSMSSRITTLLTKFRLLDRRAEVAGFDQRSLSIDYSHVPQILDAEKEKAMSFLITAFSPGNSGGVTQ